MPAPEEILQHRYQIVRPIGKGGSGAVYEAVDLRLGNRVALKQTAIPAEQTLNLLEREARLLARLRHPVLPRVIDHFVDGHYQYLVMEFIDGDDLGTILLYQSRPFDLQQVLMWAEQLLGALEYLHRQKPPVLHRDIKPQNLKLTAEGDIVLLDFGLAKGGSGGHTFHRSNESIFGYTPHYAPLEQINNIGTEPRSDLYSLAATLYHLLTGVQPPDALTRATAVLRRLPDPLIPLRQLNAAIPEDVSVVLMQALALSLDERPASATDMRLSLAKARAAIIPEVAIASSVYPADADTLSAAQVAYTVRHDVAAIQHLTPTDPPANASVMSQRAPSRAQTQPTPEMQRNDLNTIVRRFVALRQRISATGAHGWITLQGFVARLPHPWNRYALPGTILLALTLILGVSLMTSQTTAPTVASNGSSLIALTSAPAVNPSLVYALSTVPAVVDAPRLDPVSTDGSPVIKPIALRITPREVYIGSLPATLMIEGSHLGANHTFELNAPETGRLPLETVSSSSDQISLRLATPPPDVHGEVMLTLVIDGVPQPEVTLMLRDFLERKTVAGVRRDYRYLSQIGVDEAGAYTSLYMAPDSASNRFAVLRNDDVVEVLRADTPGWYEVRISQGANALHVGAVGWIERWLIDDQNVPPLIFSGILGQTPTDLAVRCGAQFRSSIYGSVEDRNGRGIADATLSITSADGRNQFTVRTRANGTYEIGGLGCTTWIVRLTAVPDFAKFQANEVRVTNLNGGRYTAAEVRFRQQP